MQLPSLKKIQAFFSAILLKYHVDRSVLLLSFFLIAILLVSFIIPQLNFGRFYGSDAYSHIINTDRMASSNGLIDFYDNSVTLVDDPSDTSYINYPFGLWLLGATLAKITGLPTITAAFFFTTLSLLILVGAFYYYSGTWLSSTEQRVFAVLFLLSMPQFSLILMNYSPNIFILPFLFLLLAIIFRDPVNWKLFPLALFSIFIIIISHTGTFVFLLGFTLAFFLLYCLFWGRFSRPVFLAIIGILSIFVAALTWFPEMINQYLYTSTKFLLPGNFLARNLNFPFPGELVRVFYKGLLVDRQFVYVIILAAILYIGGQALIYFHRKAAQLLTRKNTFAAVVLPLQNLSHSVAAAPIWLGPVHVLFSVFGAFHLNEKGKCFLLTALLTTILPDLLQGTQGITTQTGTMREITYLAIIIPITATLGLWHFLNYLQEHRSTIRSWVPQAFWITVCLVFVITPTLATTYYDPTISGEDYVIGGLEWLGQNGDHSENVVGWLLRPVSLYTNMNTAERGVNQGTEMKKYLNLLRNIYFNPGGQVEFVKEIRKDFGVRYIISSDRVLRYFGGATDELTTDSNPALSKIYASRDFRIYDVSSFSETPEPELFMSDNLSIKYAGGTYKIESDFYKVTIGANTPVLKRFGPVDNDYLNYGFLTEDFIITGTELPSGDQFKLEDLDFASEVKDNRITYTAVLVNPDNRVAVGTFIIRYTFYPDVIKREYSLSNDWLVARTSPQINVRYTIRSFSLLKEFVVGKSDGSRLERETVVYEDSVSKNVNIEDFYLHKGDEGMHITFSDVSPQPSSITYSGSIYNKSNIAITQSSPVKPGASFLSTQFIAFGSEPVARKMVQSRAGIELIPYPDGIIPIVLAGYPSTQSDSFVMEKIVSGYSVLNNNSIPYSDVINPTINPQEMRANNISIITAQRTGTTYFDDYSTQETNLLALINYSSSQNISYAGFMPYAMNYNLDTLAILSGNNTPFIVSGQVSPPVMGDYAKGYRIPQMAKLYGEPTGVVLFPVSTPRSDSLDYVMNTEGMFSDWKAAIAGAGSTDEMVFLILRSQDIGNPDFTESFIQLFSYAREKGLQFVSPDRVVDHFVKLQNISYSGFIDGDIATIQINNTNNAPVQNVTFKVSMPVLAKGNYRITGGDLARTRTLNNRSVLYVVTGIPAESSQTIRIEPDTERKLLQIGIPKFPIEGPIDVTVKDETGSPFPGVDVLIDATYYQTDANGVVRVDLKRGYHTVTINNPGYEKFTAVMNVKGRIFIIPNEISKIFIEN